MKPKWITIATETITKAEILKNRLESDGIVCMLTGISPGNARKQDKTKVKINEPDLRRAMKIIRELTRESNGYTNEDAVQEIKRILVPVDFSDYSRNACQFALKMAERHKAEIELLYAYYSPEMVTIPYDESCVYNGAFFGHLDEIRDRAREELEKYVDELRLQMQNEGREGVSLTYSLIKGSAADSILEAGDLHKSDIIILGLRGAGKRKADFLGSSTSRVIEKAIVPVLAIPENSIYDEESWANKIVYATDFDESDFSAIRKLMGLVSIFDMKVYCVHIGESMKDPWKKVKMDGLREYFNKAYPGFRVDCVLLEKQDVMEGLNTFIKKNKVDIISLTTHKRNLITKFLYPSLARKLFYHTNIPLLVFHS